MLSSRSVYSHMLCAKRGCGGVNGFRVMYNRSKRQVGMSWRELTLYVRLDLRGAQAEGSCWV